MAKPRILRVKNWDRYQHYGDRRNPPWVKLYREFLHDYSLRTMPIETRLFFACSFILASETANCIPFDLQYLSERVGFPVTVSVLKPLITSSLLLASGASDLLAPSEICSISISSSSLPVLNGKGKSERKGNGKRAICDDDKPTEKHEKLAQVWGVNLGFEWNKFKNYCLAHDKRYANFEAAFRNWMANAKEGSHAMRPVR
jgi:hypothetical protein